ncbi:oxidoreductase, partial [Oleiphilus sp. HI0069]
CIDASEVGVWLDSDEEPEALAPYLDKLPAIAINFPKFVDGRGYSYARILRDRLNFEGEIRAIGDILHDQLFYLKRCGFDAYAVREDKDIEVAQEGLSDFTESYQAASFMNQPLFRRRG